MGNWTGSLGPPRTTLRWHSSRCHQSTCSVPGEVALWALKKLSCLKLSCFKQFGLKLSCLKLSWLKLPCLKLSCLKLSCLKLSCFKLSCLKLSCLKLSCLKIADYGVRIQDSGSPSPDSCPSLFLVHALPKISSEIIFAFGQPGKKLNFIFGGVDVSAPPPQKQCCRGSEVNRKNNFAPTLFCEGG